MANSYSSLYLARDNDLLLSLPLSVREVVAARLTGAYLMGLLYTAAAFVPMAPATPLCVSSRAVSLRSAARSSF